MEEISFVSFFTATAYGRVFHVGSNCFRPIGGGKFGREGRVFSRREETLAASKMMRARATKPKHREDAYFLGEQLRAHTPSRFRKEMRVFLQRFLPIAHHYPPATYSGPALFSAVSPRIYIRMVAAFPDAGATRGGKGERNRGSSIRRANFPTERTPKTFLGDIQCLRDASRNT